MQRHLTISITIDFRKKGYEQLGGYVEEYAAKNTQGKLASAVLEIIKEHKASTTNNNEVLLVQNQQVVGKL